MNMHQSERELPDEPAPSWFHVCAAPWRGVARPGLAARILLAGSMWSVALSCVLHTVLFAVTVVVLRMWFETVELVFFEKPDFRIFTMGEVWAIWRRDAGFGTAEQTFLIAAALAVGATVCVAWLLFPYSHMGGRLWLTYGRTLRAASGAAGLVILLTAGYGVAYGVTLHRLLLSSPLPGANTAMLPVAVVAGVAPGVLWIVVWWIVRAVRSIRAPVPEHEQPPRCEGCGYDLTHLPERGRCPECDFALAESLTPGGKRPGCRWENGRGFVSWWKTSIGVLLHADRFYSTLRVRTPDADARLFARRHYVLIACCAAPCFYLANHELGKHEHAVCIAAAIVAFLGWPLLAWFVLHANATLVIFWWAARGSTLRLYLTRKIVSYEAAYLSLIAVAAAMLLASFAGCGAWITELIGADFCRRVFHTSAESAVFVAGIAVASGLWHWRITIAIRAVRWSNF